MFWLTFLILILTSVILILVWWYQILIKYASLQDIPGPKPIPIFGNALQLGNTPSEMLEKMMSYSKKYGSIFKIWIGPRVHVFITKPELVEAILSSNVHISKSIGYDLFKPWLGDGLIVSTGGKWKARRKLITPTFHFKILEKFLEIFSNHLNTLLDKVDADIEKDSYIEIHHYMNLYSLDTICETSFGTLLGAQTKTYVPYVHAVENFTNIFVRRLFSYYMQIPFLYQFTKDCQTEKHALHTLHGFAENVINRKAKEREEMKKSETQEDENQEDDVGIKKKIALLDLLLESVDNQSGLTREDIMEEVNTFLFAGHDTISSAISFAIFAIAQNPSVQEKLYEELVNVLGPDPKSHFSTQDLGELTYLDLVIKEAQRYYAPVPLIERKLESNFEIENLRLPKDCTVTIFMYGMNYNGEIFPEPHKFDTDRFLPANQKSRHVFSYVPFSAGPRNCIGQRYALVQIKAAVAKFIRKFEVSTKPDFVPIVGIQSTLRSENGVWINVKRRC